MSSIIKFPTLENEQVEVKMEDARYIRFESTTVASILNGELKIEDYGDRRRFGGKAIKLALKYCKKVGEIKTSLPYSEFRTDEELLRESENNCRAVNVDFIDEITEPGMGMVHELLAVSHFLRASRLSDLTCQYIFDHLAFKNCKTLRKAFAVQFLFTPYFSRFEIQRIEHVLDGMLELPTLEKINSEFKRTFPFSPKDIELAESENRSVRVGGNLEYKTNESSARELFIKVEYIVRRMSSLHSLSMWLKDTSSKYNSQFITYLINLCNDQSADINSGKLHFKYAKHVSTLDWAIKRCLFGQNIVREIANPCTNYEDINAIADDIDNIELKMAMEVNEQKNEADKLTKILLAKWQNNHPHHKDKIFPRLTHCLENCYHQIYSVLCSVPGWISPNEVQHHFIMSNICKKSAFECAYDPNEDQDEDVESELHFKYEEHVSTLNWATTRRLFGHNIEREIANPCTNYEDIDAIADDIDDIELKLAKEVNGHKNEADKLIKILLAKWQNKHPHHKDKIFPRLTHCLENCYHEIYSVLCSVRGWISPNEVQHHFITSNICIKSPFEYAYDPNEDQDEDVESEKQNEDAYEDVGSEEQNEGSYVDVGSEGSVSQISIADKLIRDDAVSSLTRLQESVMHEAFKFQATYGQLLRLENNMRRLAHTELLFKDEEILTFICKEKFMLYMRASEKGAGSKISFAEDKEEFNRIKIEIYEKFGGRGSKIEEAVEKYFQFHQKFHDAMVDETERQMKLHFQVEKRSKKRKWQLRG